MALACGGGRVEKKSDIPQPEANPGPAKKKPQFRGGTRMEIAGPGLDGERIDLKQYRGKVVLVDFWATWCGPCVGELPDLLKLYQKHHAAGFEVIGVSLDKSRERLKNFVKARQIPWPQIFFDEEGKREWDNPLVREYGIRGIPATFLFNREGKLMGEGFRGQSLARAVEVLLNPENAPEE
jgi:thiol-disulfide isomerase/thioredoxin